MRLKPVRLACMLLLVMLPLAGCASRHDAPAYAGLTEDDDTFCRAGGKVAQGSPEYVACRKDRDAQRADAVTRADRSQRNLGEYMLNHPDHP